MRHSIRSFMLKPKERGLGGSDLGTNGACTAAGAGAGAEAGADEADGVGFCADGWAEEGAFDLFTALLGPP